MPSATSTNQGCASSENKIQKKVENAYIDLFTHHLHKGIDVDNTALLASEEDQTHKRLYAIACNDPAITDTHIGLVDVFDKENQDTAKGQSIPKGEPVMVSSLQQFRDSWKSFTENMLSEIDWNNVAVAGGSTQQYHRRQYPDSDIDLFLYGLSPEDMEKKIIHIYNTVRGSVPYDVICVHTKNTVSVHSQHPFHVVQIVLWLYSSISEIITGYELRMVKYASRGMGILIPLLCREDVNPKIQNLYHPDMKEVFKVRGLVVDDTMETCKPREISNYAHFHVPHGPEWNTARIECHISNANYLLNSEEANLDPVWKFIGVQDEALTGEAWCLHCHPAFCGSAQDCLEGCQASQFILGWAGFNLLVSELFFDKNPGRQMMSGSFNLIDIDDWSTEAYNWDQDAKESSCAPEG
ncbi:hypothetical protein EV421DRAFT_1740048 [Armillaria borealis]|uniref:Uncharacterized protein n=1 Tax=Armillaria borealis TaxID=47425 RepID=A0AA39J5F1_9AGAR|nr:hypothetical protein EV421DRAFT_1740048 [Armillaria borealis]